MAHFALINEINTVTNVIVVSNDSLNNLPFPESEPLGQQFISNIGLDGTWLQTSYNGNFRGCYAGIGYTYDPSIDEFVAPITEPDAI